MLSKYLLNNFMYKEHISDTLANSAYRRECHQGQGGKTVTVKGGYILEEKRWIYFGGNVLLCHISYIIATVKIYKPRVIND